jgi:hypothetical protein
MKTLLLCAQVGQAFVALRVCVPLAADTVCGRARTGRRSHMWRQQDGWQRPRQPLYV